MNIHDAEKLEAQLAGAPVETQEKVRDLIDRSASANAAAILASDRVNESIKALREARDQLARRFTGVDETMTEDGPKFEIVTSRRGPSEDEIRPFTDRILRAWQDLQRYTKTSEKASAAWGDFSFLGRVSTWIADGNRVTTRSAPPAATLTKGQSHTQAVAIIRDKLAEIDVKIAATNSAPAPVADLISRMDAAIDAEAERYSFNIYTETRDRAPVNMSAMRTENLGPFVLWALSDEVKAGLAAKIKAAHPGNAVADFDRAAELAALDADKLALYRQEESHIVAASEIGQHIARRSDVDLRAVLEVE